MKRIITSALAILLFVGASQAQDGSRHHGKEGQKIAKELNLSAEQKDKLKSIHQAERSEMEGLKQKGQVTPEQRKAIHEKYKAQLDAVLTPAQREQWKQKKEDWKDDRKDRKDGDHGNKGEHTGQMAGFFKKELNLTPDQETRLKSIFGEYGAKAKDIRTNNSLTKEQQKEQMQSLAKQYMAQGKSVLTPEQLQKLEQVKNERKHKRDRNS